MRCDAVFRGSVSRRFEGTRCLRLEELTVPKSILLEGVKVPKIILLEDLMVPKSILSEDLIPQQTAVKSFLKT